LRSSVGLAEVIHPAMTSGITGSSEKMREQANQEQHNEHEEANSGYFSRRERYKSKAEEAGNKGDYQEHQRIVKHGGSFLGHGCKPDLRGMKQVPCQLPSPHLFNDGQFFAPSVGRIKGSRY
jgi:hypothetical protein